ADHEEHGENRGRLRQHRRAGARAERRLAAPAAERRCHVALALLQQDDQQQHQAGQHVKGREQVIQNHGFRLCSVRENEDYTAAWRLRATISVKPRTSRLAPPTSAPSTSASAASSRTFSGFTLPP